MTPLETLGLRPFFGAQLELLGEPKEPGATEHLRAIQQRSFLDEISPSLRDSRLRALMSAHPDLCVYHNHVR